MDYTIRHRIDCGGGNIKTLETAYLYAQYTSACPAYYLDPRPAECIGSSNAPVGDNGSTWQANAIGTSKYHQYIASEYVCQSTTAINYGGVSFVKVTAAEACP
ncbi:hypothetical protein TBR22_A12930 [Luteitalea sp. TBR-22]|uniref:hypothetical protein n=1 Tax=Luteitalea sp. TBR-22 TaxID=2802971 RepID=UPI001AF6EA77|nr:hypothetical protein [Luteitalea sp. TBR-22]BCS32085.1 hypothetical protein TBR22_A12930 [Luteitalea sp. TBR-22]